MQMNKKTKYLDAFCQVLEEEKIPFSILGRFNNHLPISKVCNAPMADSKEGRAK